MSGVQHLKVEKADDGQRLDRWLKKNLPGAPYGLLQKLIRKGQLRVDGKRAKTDTRLSAGQDVRIPPLEDKPEKKKKQRVFTDKDREFIQSLVIYDDGDVLAFNKPSGLATQGGEGIKDHIDAYFPLLEKDELTPRLVHRLDRGTSGILLAARSADSVRRLGKSFKEHDVRKIYWAITAGKPEAQGGTVSAPLGKAPGPLKDKMVIDEKDGKEAVTEFAVIDYAMDTAAFVAFWPRTGRTHQIRVHAADVLDCPVLGDGKYGEKEAGLEGLDIAKRLHLHAQSIMCPHPVQKGMLDIQAPLPKELVKSWKALGFDPAYKGDPFADIKA